MSPNTLVMSRPIGIVDCHDSCRRFQSAWTQVNNHLSKSFMWYFFVARKHFKREKQRLNRVLGAGDTYRNKYGTYSARPPQAVPCPRHHQIELLCVSVSILMEKVNLASISSISIPSGSYYVTLPLTSPIRCFLCHRLSCYIYKKMLVHIESCCSSGIFTNEFANNSSNKQHY